VAVGWQQRWHDVFGVAPARPSSCEWSIQGVLERLIAGSPIKDGTPVPPTHSGAHFLSELVALALRRHINPSWFEREHRLDIPLESRTDKRRTCNPDYAVGDGSDTVMIELKSDVKSARGNQPDEYLRYGRLRHPSGRCDLILIAPTTPRLIAAVNDSQSYAEVTWATVWPLIGDAFGSDCEALVRFLIQEFS
jgi:hypothetical protein